MTWVLGLVSLLVGAVLGYVVRLTEFRRERRLVAYGDFIGTFLAVAHAGAGLLSLYMQYGEGFRDEEHREESVRLWTDWGRAAESFEAATARLRLVGSDARRGDAEKLEDFITENVRRVPPVFLTEGTEGWGEAAKVGPARVDSEALRLARLFADRAHGEITRWRPAGKLGEFDG